MAVNAIMRAGDQIRLQHGPFSLLATATSTARLFRDRITFDVTISQEGQIPHLHVTMSERYTPSTARNVEQILSSAIQCDLFHNKLFSCLIPHHAIRNP